MSWSTSTTIGYVQGSRQASGERVACLSAMVERQIAALAAAWDHRKLLIAEGLLLDRGKAFLLACHLVL